MIRIFLKRFLGVLALLTGLSLIGWFIYNQFWPTDEFKKGFQSVFQLGIPILCIGVGWKWLTCKG